MMGARVTLASGASGALSKACTIAVRYCAVRKQGFKTTSEKRRRLFWTTDSHSTDS